MKVDQQVKPHQWTDGGEHVLILRRINADGTSYCGFDEWGKPDELNIVVEPEKWSPNNECGNGLHGWPWGMGLGGGSDHSIIDDRWLVLAVRPEDVMGELEGESKCKCRHAKKIFDGSFAGAWAMINSGRHRLIEAMANSGVGDVASGDGSKAASSGDGSKAASSGDRSKAASSGDRSTAASSGDGSKAASSGDYSKAASSGDYSTAAQTGKSGVAAAIGDPGTAQAGENGAIVLCYWSAADDRYRVVVGYVGENGIKADTLYWLNSKHEFEEVR